MGNVTLHCDCKVTNMSIINLITSTTLFYTYNANGQINTDHFEMDELMAKW